MGIDDAQLGRLDSYGRLRKLLYFRFRDFIMTVHVPDFDKLVEQISNLEIDVSVSSEGIYTACSSSEPFFCFDGYSQSEVAERAFEAIESYARVYYGVSGFSPKPRREDVQQGCVTIETSRTVSKLTLAAA